VGRGDLVERIEKMDTVRKETVDRERGLRAEVLRLVGEQALLQGQYAWIHRTEKATHDFDFLSTVAATFITSSESKAIIMTSALAGSTSPALLVVLSGDNEVAKGLNEKLKTALDPKRIKGGGAKGRYMSKIEGSFGKTQVAAVSTVFEEVCRMWPELMSSSSAKRRLLWVSGNAREV
jgi:alanyl-tRNA synthetase